MTFRRASFDAVHVRGSVPNPLNTTRASNNALDFVIRAEGEVRRNRDVAADLFYAAALLYLCGKNERSALDCFDSARKMKPDYDPVQRGYSFEGTLADNDPLLMEKKAMRRTLVGTWFGIDNVNGLFVGRKPVDIRYIKRKKHY